MPTAPATNSLYAIATHVLGNAEEPLRERIAKHLASLTRDDLDAARAHPRRGTLTGRDVLIVVARHAAEHWGEAQLTRSLMKARAGGRPS